MTLARLIKQAIGKAYKAVEESVPVVLVAHFTRPVGSFWAEKAEA